jgi:lipase
VILHTRRWGPERPDSVVCVHGIAQHGGIFAGLGERLAARGHSVIAVDLRGHGDSERLPPWSVETHVEDLFETLAAAGVERADWVGHSFGGRLAAAAAAREPERTQRLVLLDAAVEVPAAVALQSAEIERLDWSFATPEGAVNALLSTGRMVAAPHEVVEAYAKDDLRKGPDGRLRFSFSPSAVVVAWSEMVLPAPPIARLPTLVVRPEVPLFDPSAQDSRYREALGDLLTEAVVPNGHNVLWEAPEETISVIEGFLGRAA